MPTPAGKPRFFKTQADFATWLEKNHERADEIWVGFYKKTSGRASITWPEAVDVALRFGWIDGIRKSIDDESYMNRLTPRRVNSNWSARNIRRVKELVAEGLMHPAGLKAFEARADERSAIYSYEQRHDAQLDPGYEKELRNNRKAWSFYASTPPSYKKAVAYWVMSAKREETRQRRLSLLIEHSAAGERVPPLAPSQPRAKKPR